jgi:nucleoside 2-deoxyribosyltransferase
MKKQLKFDVYLAGAMHGRLGRDVLNEREAARAICKDLGIRAYDPAEDEVIHSSQIIDAKPNLRRMRWFVDKDFRNLDQCRAIVVLTGDRSSSGTAWEMARMYFRWRRPIILVAPKMHDRRLVNFTTILATKICPTQMQAFRALKRVLRIKGVK